VVLLVGGVLALSIGSFGFALVTFCLTALGGACLGFSLLVALPAVTGIVTIGAAIFGYVRPARHAVAGAIALSFSLGTIAVGLALFAPFPSALMFLLLFLGWPILITTIGGALLLVWKPDPTWPPSPLSAAWH
jgi:hypothetical protein